MALSSSGVSDWPTLLSAEGAAMAMGAAMRRVETKVLKNCILMVGKWLKLGACGFCVGGGFGGLVEDFVFLLWLLCLLMIRISSRWGGSRLFYRQNLGQDCLISSGLCKGSLLTPHLGISNG